jgi:CheY-like chemotaxis protein
MNFVNALVVDDEAFCIDVVKKLLEKIGFQNVSSARNGKEAISIICENASKNNFFQLIVMDCNMPIMTGFDASRKINEMISKNIIPQVSIIALTANIASTDEQMCKSAGMSYYMTKPVRFNEFQNKIHFIFDPTA